MEEDTDAQKSVFQLKQEKEVDPPDPKNVSLLKDSSCLASEAVQINPNHTLPPCRTTPRNVCAYNGELCDIDADSQPTPRQWRQASGVEAFSADDICVTCMKRAVTGTHNMDVIARCTENVP